VCVASIKPILHNTKLMMVFTVESIFVGHGSMNACQEVFQKKICYLFGNWGPAKLV